MRAGCRFMIVGVIVVACLIGLIFAGYWFDWTGFDGYTKITTAHIISGPSKGTVTRTEEYQPGKALWDWLQLLIIPAVLAIGGYLFTYTTSRNDRKAADLHNQIEREIAFDNQCQAILQAYINKMSELLLHERLRDSAEEDEVRKIARVQTLTVLSQLDGRRKKSVMQFLFESELIWAQNNTFQKKNIILLAGADLDVADLSGIELSAANLSHVNLRHANLSYTGLIMADLNRSNLRYANLRKANLKEAIRGRHSIRRLQCATPDWCTSFLLLTSCFLFGILSGTCVVLLVLHK